MHLEDLVTSGHDPEADGPLRDVVAKFISSHNTAEVFAAWKAGPSDDSLDGWTESTFFGKTLKAISGVVD